MKARIVRIGNSKGIRIPKPLLEQSGIEDEVELEIEHGRIIIRAVSHPRRGWEEAARKMAARGEDVLIDGAFLPHSDWDEEEWEW